MNRPEDISWKLGSLRLDTAQRLLFRDEELVPLSRKAIDILVVLLERHGQLVEKEDLMRRVWPDSFVEESNLAVHISQLRKTLGEEGDEYRIETIPRRGYRFIGAVERESASPEPAVHVSGSISEPESSLAAPEPASEETPNVETAGLPTQAEAPNRRRSGVVWVSAGLAAALIIGLTFFTLRFRDHGKAVPAGSPGAVSGSAAPKDSIVLGEIANNTGEPVFDTTLREAMVIELEQSPYLSLISEERLQQSLKLMGKPAATALTPELARELCQRNSGEAVLDGWIAKLGTQYVLGVRAVNCRTGDHLADLQTTAAGKELVLKALGDITGQLRARLGESLSTVQKFDTPIEEATTSSLEALQAYSIGRQTMVQKGESAACVPFFQQAIRIDPAFAIAYAALGNAYSNLGETGLAATNIRKAYELSSHVSEHERLYIESHYHQFVTGDLIKASQIYELWAATYPNDQAPRTNLAVIYSDLGKFDRSLELAKEAVRIAAHDGQSYANLVDAYISMNNPDQANAVAEQAMSQHLDSSQLRLYLYDVAFLQHNSDGMQKQMNWASGEPGIEDAFLDDQADDLAASGQLARARELTGRATEAARRAEEMETAAGYELDEAQREAEFGNDAEAQRAAEAALSLAKDRDTKYGAAVALALGGAADRAQALAIQLDKDFPNDTFVQYLYLPTVRGAMAVKQKDPARALQALEAARPYEVGIAGGLLPVYIRGLAYLESNDGEKAGIEFQKILDHPGVVLNAPIGPLARLQLGRACQMQGKSAQAKAAYEDFLSRWRNGDPDIPILREAKAEYAKQWTPLVAQH
jgi:DNA-binding winged helix-turn-helix (wHTH) protein/Flp pilus assembly protein TadD